MPHMSDGGSCKRDAIREPITAHRLRASVSEVLDQHRSMRHFADREVPRHVIEEAISNAVSGTSSYGNLNCASVILTADPERIATLRQLHFNQPTVRSAPIILTMCADVHRLCRWLDSRGARTNFENLHGLALGAVDACLLAQSIALGLEASGVGICFLGTTLDACIEIAHFLELPRGCFPITSLALGYPADAPVKRQRLPLRAQLFDERYPAIGDENVASWFTDREAADWTALMQRDRPAFEKIIDLGIRNFAQYCTSDFRYAPEQSDATAKALLRAMRKLGFRKTIVA